MLRCLCSVTPREEFVEACDLVVGDLGKDPCEPGFKIIEGRLGADLPQRDATRSSSGLPRASFSTA